MPRTKRRESQTEVYHIIVRGNNKENIFEKEKDKTVFTKILKKKVKDYKITVYAYCIMRNHAHIMIKSSFNTLPDFMRHTNSTYAEYYNSKYDRTGHVFQGRYYSDCIETEEYYWSCLRYIHNNPVKIQLAKEPYDYEFGSASEYFSGTSEILSGASYEMLKSRFQSMDEFWSFHHRFDSQDYLDTVEDKRFYNYERVKILVERYMFEHKIEEVQIILTISDIKRDFISTCKRETGLSDRRIENILKMDCKRA